MALEIYSNSNYSYKVDVYSFALIFNEVCTEKVPFSNYNNKYKLMEDKEKGKLPDLSLIDDKVICGFIKKCLSQDPEKRSSFAKIVFTMLTHNFVIYFDISNEILSHYLNLFDDMKYN